MPNCQCFSSKLQTITTIPILTVILHVNLGYFPQCSVLLVFQIRLSGISSTGFLQASEGNVSENFIVFSMGTTNYYNYYY